MDKNMAVSMRLQSELWKAKKKNVDFAEATGVTPETLSRYLHGKANIPDEYIEKAAKELNITAGYLTGEEDVAINVKLRDSFEKLFGMLNEDNHIVVYTFGRGFSSRNTFTSSRHEFLVDGRGIIVADKITGEVNYRLSVGSTVISNEDIDENGTGIVTFILMDEKNEKVIAENIFVVQKITN